MWPLGEGVVQALALVSVACGNAQHLQLAAPCHDTQAAAQLVAVETAAARVEDVDVGWLPLCPLEMTLLAQLAVQRVGAGDAELAMGQHRHVAAHCAQGLVHRRSIDGRRRITFDGHLRSVNGRCLGLHLNVDEHCVSTDGHYLRRRVARKLEHRNGFVHLVTSTDWSHGSPRRLWPRRSAALAAMPLATGLLAQRQRGGRRLRDGWRAWRRQRQVVVRFRALRIGALIQTVRVQQMPPTLVRRLGAKDVGNPVCDMLQHAERSPMTVQRRVGLHALHAVNDELKDARIGLRLPSLKAGGGGGVVALLVVRLGERVL